MWIVIAAALASVVGLVAAVFALVLLSHDLSTGQSVVASRRGMGALSLLAAGFLLAFGGQYKSSVLVYYRAWRTEAMARARLILQEPMERINLHVTGPDPFADQPSVTALRLRVVTLTGANFDSEIPQGQIKLPKEAPQMPHSYYIAWQSVLGGVTSDEGRAVAARIGHLNDWQRVDRIEAGLVTAERVSMPDTLWIGFHDSGELGFHGQKTPESPARQADGWVTVYREDYSPANKIASMVFYPQPPKEEAGTPLMGSLVLGGILLVVGFGMVLAARSPIPVPAPNPAAFGAAPRPWAIDPGSLASAVPLATPQPAPPPSAVADLLTAVGLRVGYTVSNKTKVLTISEPDEVKSVLASLTVTGEEKKLDVKFFPLGTVDFLLADQKVLSTKLVSPTHIEKDDWGQIYVTDGFYEKICEVVSKAERKPMDVLKNNP
jgi:hypothetical protein